MATWFRFPGRDLSWQKVTAFFFDTRFAKYWSNLVHLDFGVSTADRRPVFDTVLSKLKYSLSLTFTSVLLAYAIAVPIGVFSAIRQGTKVDAVVTIVLFVLYSLPTFFTGTVLLRLLTEGEPVAWFPTGDFQTMTSDPMTTWASLKDILWHLVLPIATYTSVSLATLSRYARAGVIEVIRADYIRTARAKGLSEPVVIIKHAGRYQTVYAHNRRNLVRKGEFVEKGQMIAEVGASGNASGPHLHFEIRRDRRRFQGR